MTTATQFVTRTTDSVDTKDRTQNGGASSGTRIVNVVRLQFINKYTFLWIPLIIIAAAVLISLAIYGMIGSDSPMYGGAGQAPLWYFLVVGVQAMSLTFPFSQAMSLTRREFYLGTVLAAALSAAVLASFYVVLGFVEQATDGYGLNGYISHLPWVWDSGWAGAAAIVFTLTMFFFLVGFWIATIYRRSGTMALTLILVGLAVFLLAVIFVITRMEAWPTVLSAFATMGPFGAAGILACLTLVVAAGAWLTLRRSVH